MLFVLLFAPVYCYYYMSVCCPYSYMSIVLLHMSCCTLNYCTTLYAYLCNTPTSGAMAGSPASAEEVGELLQLCVSLCGALFGFSTSSTPRWGADECRLMILGVGGIRVSCLCPTVKYGWHMPSGLRCWELTFPRFFCRDCWHHVEVTFEWNGCSLIFMSAFRLFFTMTLTLPGQWQGLPPQPRKWGKYYAFIVIFYH